MINLGLIMGTVGGAVGIILGILIFSTIGANVDCPGDIGTPQETPAITGVDKNEDGDFTDSGYTAPVAAKANTSAQGYTECTNAKSITWTVLGILPITLFFGLFALFGSRQ